MKTNKILILYLAPLMSTVAVAQSASDDEKGADKRQMPHHMSGDYFYWQGGGHPKDMKVGPVTYLGVQIAPVNPVVSAQLGIEKGFGLTVINVSEDSPADKAGLNKFDILKLLDDQILIDPRQLKVLVRSKKEGDKVKLTILREGREMKIDVTFTKKDLDVGFMPGREGFSPRGVPFPIQPPSIHGMGLHPAGIIENMMPGAMDYYYFDPSKLRENMMDLREKLDRIHEHGFDFTIGDVYKSYGDSSAARTTIIRMKNMNIVYENDEGSMTLSSKMGQKFIKVYDAEGNKLFDGPYTSEEDLNDLPEKWLKIIRKLESNEDIEFEIDEKFTPDDIRVYRSPGHVDLT